MPSVGGVQISGVHVSLAVGGIVLVYAGLRDTNPLAAVRDLVSGKPPPVNATSANLVASAPGGSIASSAVPGAIAGAGAAALIGAAQRHAGEKYSQTLRWQPGYSDCSSFVGKSFRDIGVTPPGASLAASYLTWSKLRRVDRSQLAGGDLCVNTGHIILATGHDTAIGQQNSRDNVQVGRPENLMWGTGSFVCLRYAWGG